MLADKADALTNAERLLIRDAFREHVRDVANSTVETFVQTEAAKQLCPNMSAWELTKATYHELRLMQTEVVVGESAVVNFKE